MALPVTAFFAGVLALWLIFLQLRVIRFRRANDVSIGSGGDEGGARLIRGHANAAENIPIFLILLGLSEGMGGPLWLLIVLGLIFTAGRVMHGLHFMELRPPLTLRFYGMVLTFAALVIAALRLILGAIF